MSRAETQSVTAKSSRYHKLYFFLFLVLPPQTPETRSGFLVGINKRMTEEKKKRNKPNHTPGKAFKEIVQTTLISS